MATQAPRAIFMRDDASPASTRGVESAPCPGRFVGYIVRLASRAARASETEVTMENTDDHHFQRARRTLGLAALAAVTTLALVGLTQCRLVNEPVTGVDVTATTANGHSHCVHR